MVVTDNATVIAAAAAGGLSFILAIVGLAGHTWLTHSDETYEIYVGLWGIGGCDTQGHCTYVSCSDMKGSLADDGCSRGGAAFFMVVTVLALAVACCISVMLVLERPVPMIPECNFNPVKTAGCLFGACAVMQWIALIAVSVSTSLMFSTGGSGVAVVLGSLLCAITGLRLVQLAKDQEASTKNAGLVQAMEGGNPYQGV
jgi:hypothetical protein